MQKIAYQWIPMRALLISVLSLFLAACGQSGPLYLPQTTPIQKKTQPLHSQPACAKCVKTQSIDHETNTQ